MQPRNIYIFSKCYLCCDPCLLRSNVQEVAISQFVTRANCVFSALRNDRFSNPAFLLSTKVVIESRNIPGWIIFKQLSKCLKLSIIQLWQRCVSRFLGSALKQSTNPGINAVLSCIEEARAYRNTLTQKWLTHIGPLLNKVSR